MPVLIFGAQRRDLHVGRNTLGGTGDIVFPVFAGLPALAAITLSEDGVATITALGEEMSLQIDGVSLGTEPVELRDGATVRVGRRELVYRAESTAEPAVTGASSSHTARKLTGASGEQSGWRLIELQTGHIHEIPLEGIVIGRDDDCDIVVASHDVSRRHAVIRRVGTGYTLTDESVNGTFVNDVRVQSVQILARGDKLRIGTTVFRLERSTSSANGSDAETHRLPAVMLVEESGESEASPQIPNAHRPSGTTGSTELAVLEVVRGPIAGTRFGISRAVCSIGRSEDNDIVIADESVSSAHATLLLKAGSWYVIDLRSDNGTYVDGYRVAAERMLSDGSVLTVGQVKMIFGPASQSGHEPHGTQPLLGMFQQLAKRIRGR